MAAPVCIITGASRGIGLATALRFAALKYNIVAAARGPEELGRARQRIESAGVACEAIELDLTEPNSGAELIEAATNRFGRADVLVNNAGTAAIAPLEEASAALFKHLMTLNCGAVFRTTQAVWPIMKCQGAGVIVNISSVAAIDPYPGFAIYGATKAWVNLLTKALATEGAPHGIRLYAVAPAAVETALLRNVVPDVPADRCLAPDDVAAVVESVCDPRMAHCSGDTIFVRRNP